MREAELHGVVLAHPALTIGREPDRAGSELAQDALDLLPGAVVRMPFDEDDFRLAVHVGKAAERGFDISLLVPRRNHDRERRTPGKRLDRPDKDDGDESALSDQRERRAKGIEERADACEAPGNVADVVHSHRLETGQTAEVVQAVARHERRRERALADPEHVREAVEPGEIEIEDDKTHTIAAIDPGVDSLQRTLDVGIVIDVSVQDEQPVPGGIRRRFKRDRATERSLVAHRESRKEGSVVVRQRLEVNDLVEVAPVGAHLLPDQSVEERSPAQGAPFVFRRIPRFIGVSATDPRLEMAVSAVATVVGAHGSAGSRATPLRIAWAEQDPPREECGPPPSGIPPPGTTGSREAPAARPRLRASGSRRPPVTVCPRRDRPV